MKWVIPYSSQKYMMKQRIPRSKKHAHSVEKPVTTSTSDIYTNHMAQSTNRYVVQPSFDFSIKKCQEIVSSKYSKSGRMREGRASLSKYGEKSARSYFTRNVAFCGVRLVDSRDPALLSSRGRSDVRSTLYGYFQLQAAITDGSGGDEHVPLADFIPSTACPGLIG
jgi:hypothetical protein